MTALRSFLLLLLALLLTSLAGGAVTFVLSGQIRDVEGRPVAGAEVFVYDTPNIRRPADFISAKTTSDGRYRLILPQRHYWAVARVRAGEQFGPLLPGDRQSGEALPLEADDRAELVQDFTVVNLREAAKQKIKTREGLLIVRGRTLDRHGAPLADVYVFADQEPKVTGIPAYVSAWTGPDGSYALHLPTGSYCLGVSREFPPPPGTTGKRELILAPGENETVIDFQESL